VVVGSITYHAPFDGECAGCPSPVNCKYQLQAAWQILYPNPALQPSSGARIYQGGTYQWTWGMTPSAHQPGQDDYTLNDWAEVACDNSID